MLYRISRCYPSVTMLLSVLLWLHFLCLTVSVATGSKIQDGIPDSVSQYQQQIKVQDKINGSIQISRLPQTANSVSTHKTRILRDRGEELPHVKNVYREKRADIYRDPLSSAMLPMTKDCPVDMCNCYTDTETNRLIINCRYQSLYSVPTFKVVTTTFSLITFSKNNFISKLLNNSFANLKVERIDLLENKLTNVQPGAFNGLQPYLQELLIEGNGKTSIEIPFSALTSLSNLRRLVLKSFRQDTLMETNYFGYFPNLEHLEIDSVSLQYVHSLAFKNKLSKLTHLRLDTVDFQDLPVECLQYLSSLTTIYFRFTKIHTVYSQSFEKLRLLKYLDLSHNSINVLQTEAFVGISSQLVYLDLSSNNLQAGALQALASKTWNSLQQLLLSYNAELSNIPVNVFKYMPNLQYLNLAETNLKHLQLDMFNGLVKVTNLDLSYNNIETIQDRIFLNMNALEELKLDHQFQNGIADQSLEITPAAFSGLENRLVVLDLEKTTLKERQFWNTVKIFNQLKKLIVSETKIKEIPSYAFYNNKQLQTIELNNNGINYINQDAFRGLEQVLKDVSLKDNNVTTISECVFKNFTRLEQIHLMRNPLDCDCRIQWLHTFILTKTNVEPPIDINEYICNKPAIFATKTLSSIPSDDLTCSQNSRDICRNPIDISSTNPTSPSTSNTDKVNSLKLTIAGTTSSAITVAWSVTDKSKVTGFKLVYKPANQQEPGIGMSIHRDQITHTLYNLAQGTFYQVCVTAEVNNVEDQSVRDCQTVQTLGQSSNTDSHVDTGNSNGDNRNVITGAIIATVAVVVLIAVGVCAVVRYKVLKLKELQFALQSMGPRRVLADEDNKMYICTVPNEYSEIDVARIASKYNIKSPKHMQRQFGVDNFSFDITGEAGSYDLYHKIGRRKRNPYENDDEEDQIKPVQLSTDKNEVHFKNDLEQRHSAPSRLDAENPKNPTDRNSRPLPATPAEPKPQAVLP